MDKRVLISGNRGFIGGHLENALREKGYDVIGYDIKDGLDIRDMMAHELWGVDTVFHLAAQAKVPLSIEQPYTTNDHNINGTLNVLVAARDAGVRRVIYSASSSAYGEQDTMPLREDMKPNPMSPYGIQKLVGEMYCKVFSEIFGLQTVSLRYFNVYGEGMPVDGAYSAAIAVFLKQRSEGKPLTVFGGLQSRDFTNVSDVVRANILAMEADTDWRGEVINIGGGSEHRIIDIAKAISENIEGVEQRKGEPMRTIADITKAKELLGWEPSVNVIDWLKSQK